MNKFVSPKITALTFGVLVIAFLAVFYVVAWQEPSQAPPSGNVPAPLNVGPVGQSKEGGLILNTGGAANGLIVDKGNLCLGTDCRSSWPVTGVITTYNMSAQNYQSGNTYYSKSVSYTCSGGADAVKISCTSVILNAGCGWGNFDACGCSISGGTATVSSFVASGSRDGCSARLDQCTSPPLYSCGGLPSPCNMEFQCGIKQTVGQ